MASKKITDLTNYTSQLDADVFPIVDVAGDETKKIAYSVIKADILSEVPTPSTLVQEIYTGSDYDSSSSGVQTVEGSHELIPVTSGIAANGTYVKVRMTGTITAVSDTNISKLELKAQIKETGQSYADIVVYKTIVSCDIGTGSDIDNLFTYTYEVIATLTAGMKNNGFQIQAFSKSTTIQTGDNVQYQNVQTVVELA